MTFDSLIAVAALLLAVYAIVPRSKQLAFWLRVKWLQIVIVVFTLIVIHILLLFPNSPLVDDHPLSSQFDPNQLAYLIFAIGFVLLVFTRWRLPFPKRKLPELLRYVQRLLETEDYDTIAALFNDHLDELVRVAEHESSADHFDGVVSVSHILQSAFTHLGFISAVSRNYPDLGIRIMRLESHEYEFTDEFLRSLLRHEGGLLCSELNHNLNIESDGGYRLDARNRLLHAFFHEASFAEHRALYKPVGEAMLDELNMLAVEPQADPYVRDVDRSFRERLQLRQPLFAGLRFFEIMIWCSLRKGIKWHMWLYYFPHFTEAACRNCDLHPDSFYDTSEWPNRYCYFIYEIVSALIDWGTSVAHKHIRDAVPPLESSSGDHQNDSIPKSSIIALGSCLDHLVKSAVISRKYQYEMLSRSVEMYFTLRRHPDCIEYAEVVLNVLIRRRSEKYYALLSNVLQGLDTVHFLDEHVKELRARYSKLAD